jgi:hypothetical protein
VVQRFRSDCGLYVHVHLLAGDGVWQELPDGDVAFRPLTDLREVDLVRVLDDLAVDLVAAAVLDDELPSDYTLTSFVDLLRRPRLPNQLGATKLRPQRSACATRAAPRDSP